MKKVFSLLLTILMLSVSITAFAESAEENEINVQGIVTAEELIATMSAEDDAAAFTSWAKACTAIIIAMKNSAYDCAVGAYEYDGLKSPPSHSSLRSGVAGRRAFVILFDTVVSADVTVK